MSYLGRTGKLSQRAYNKLSFLATAGQTVKAGLSYVAGFVEVYVNGTLLTDVVDYSASNGNSVTFLVALSVDDEVTVVSLKTFVAANMLPLSGGTLNGDLGVTGSVTADGLVVDGGALIQAGNTLTLNRTDNATGGEVSYVAGTGFILNDVNGDGTSFNVGTANRMRIDSSGNVGIGVVPKTWTMDALQLGLNAALAEDANSVYLTANAYSNGGWKRTNAKSSGYIRLGTNDGLFSFSNAAGGEADSDIVWSERMRIDANGHITTPAQPAFAAYSNIDTYTVSSNSPFNCNATRFNRGNHYSTAAAMFVAPVSGVYEFTFRTIYINNVTNASIGFHLNGAQYYGSLVHFTSTQGGNWKNVSTSILVNLSANDTVAPYNGGGEVTYHGNAWQEFSGKLLG